jgi:histidine triad (HIT) family protein
MATIFTKIWKKEIPSYSIAENDQFYAFLDINPLVKGHTLVIPKKEVDYIFDIDDEEYKELWGFAKNVAKKIEKAIPCKRVGIAVIGLEVPHTHIHLIPINNVSDINFAKPKLQLSDEEMRSIADTIIRA